MSPLRAAPSCPWQWLEMRPGVRGAGSSPERTAGSSARGDMRDAPDTMRLMSWAMKMKAVSTSWYSWFREPRCWGGAIWAAQAGCQRIANSPMRWACCSCSHCQPQQQLRSSRRCSMLQTLPCGRWWGKSPLSCRWARRRWRTRSAQGRRQLGCQCMPCSSAQACRAHGNALEDTPDENLRDVKGACQYNGRDHEQDARVGHDPGPSMIPAQCPVVQSQCSPARVSARLWPTCSGMQWSPKSHTVYLHSAGQTQRACSLACALIWASGRWCGLACQEEG